MHPEWSLLQGNGTMGYDLSPDGNDFAFASYRDGTWELCTLSLYGGDPRRVAAGPGHKLAVKWSPQGDVLAFVRVDADGPRVCTVAVSGGEPQVVAPLAGPSWEPEWSPEGDRLTFVAAPAGVPELWLHVVETGVSRAVVAGPVRSPGWSPDGAFICYLLGDEPADLTLAYASGWGADGSPRLLTTGVCGISPPRWSPAGRQIVVTKLHAGRRRVEVVSSAIGRCTAVVGTGLEQWDPTWTSNGAAVAYLNATAAGVGLEQQTLPTLGAPPAVRQPIRLSRPDGLASAALFTPGKPRALYAYRQADEPPELYVQIVAGGHPQRLTSSSGSADWLVGRPVAVPGVPRAVQVGRPTAAAAVWVVEPGAASAWNPIVQDLAGAGVWVLQVELPASGLADGADQLTAALAFCHQAGAARVGLVLDGEPTGPALPLGAMAGCAALAVRGGEFWPTGPRTAAPAPHPVPPAAEPPLLPMLWLLADSDPRRQAISAMVQAGTGAGQRTRLVTCPAPGGLISGADMVRGHHLLVQFMLEALSQHEA